MNNAAVTVLSVLVNPKPSCCSHGELWLDWENSTRNQEWPQPAGVWGNQRLGSACAALREPKCFIGFCSLFFHIFSLDMYLEQSLFPNE